MSNVRPDENKIQNALKEKTGVSWRLTQNEPSEMSFVNTGGQYKIHIKYEDNWLIRVYDRQWDEEEPRFALGPIREAKQVIPELRGVIPTDQF